jgi:SagB-type dehydrogenase family enzyme
MSNRNVDIAHLYHESTKLFYLELHKKPPAFKLYRELPLLPLPTDFSPLVVPALEAIAATEPAAPPTRAFDLTMLAGLLFFAAGRIKQRTFAGVGEVSFRAAASAGGLYPVEVYVVCGDLPGLAAGVYHFSPADFALRGLRQGDYRQVLAQAAAGDQTVATAPCTLVFSAIFWRSAWKYRVRSYRYCFWDNGTVVANLCAAATAAGLPARIVMGFVDAQVNHLLGLDGHREASTCLVSIGPSADLLSLEHPDQVPPLVAETVPPTTVEVDYPEITRLHTASTLTTPEEVMAWRAPRMQPPGWSVAPQHPLYSLDAAIAPSHALGDVIRQRGSTRRFARELMSFAQLSAILSSATTGIPADFLGQGGGSLLDIYLIVHAVEGLPTGSYVFAPQAQAFELLAAGAYRDAAGHLCFEQALGADASVVVFFMADLTDVLQRFGNRGYRAVQLEAGAIGGKMYLGAGALGLGASGLTFYDDEVTAFFAPHAAGKSPIFVVALGHTARENRVQPFRSRAAMAIDAMSRRDF